MKGIANLVAEILLIVIAAVACSILATWLIEFVKTTLTWVNETTWYFMSDVLQLARRC